MVHHDSLLVTLLKQVDRLPMPAEPVHTGRGRPKVYANRVFIKALLIMIVRHFSQVHEFYTALHQPTADMLQLRDLRERERTVSVASDLGTPLAKPFLRGCRIKSDAWDGIW